MDMPLSFLELSGWKLGVWSANSIEPGAGWSGSVLVAKANQFRFQQEKD